MSAPETRLSGKAAALAEHEAVRAEFVQKMGLGPQDSVDDWIREGLQKLPVCNAEVQGDVLTRCSVGTRTKALRAIMEQFGV